MTQFRAFVARRVLPALALSGFLAACGAVSGPVQPVPKPTQPQAAQTVIVAPTGAATLVPAPTAAPSALPVATVAPTFPPMPTAPAVPTAPLAQPAGSERIAFAPGAVSGTVEGALVRGEERRYLLWAQAGQTMAVRVTSAEANAVFQIYAPDGAALSGAEPGRDAQFWSGVLPANGEYQLVVGSMRGNASYRLDLTVTSPTSPAPENSIRSANWDVVLANDPRLRVEYQGSDRYVTVTDPAAPVSGIPQFDQLIYLDMDGDGVEEAAMPLFSGGTAGNIGALIFRMGARTPVFSDSVGGYKLGVGVEQGRLVVSNALYAGWEPNCCPSGRSYDTYTLQGDRLQLLDHRDEGIADVQPLTVERYYELLRRQEYAAAYGLLAPQEQAANPYDSWVTGFANTLDLQATTSIDTSAPDTVSVSLTATDRAADGGQVVRRFVGTWRLVWEPSRPGWALASPQIAELP